ncbi:MAG: hypothetical protein NVS9B13_01810 [Candidatus Acidiferrum sp.]
MGTHGSTGGANKGVRPSALQEEAGLDKESRGHTDGKGDERLAWRGVKVKDMEHDSRTVTDLSICY